MTNHVTVDSSNALSIILGPRDFTKRVQAFKPAYSSISATDLVSLCRVADANDSFERPPEASFSDSVEIVSEASVGATSQPANSIETIDESACVDRESEGQNSKEKRIFELVDARHAYKLYKEGEDENFFDDVSTVLSELTEFNPNERETFEKTLREYRV